MLGIGEDDRGVFSGDGVVPQAADDSMVAFMAVLFRAGNDPVGSAGNRKRRARRFRQRGESLCERRTVVGDAVSPGAEFLNPESVRSHGEKQRQGHQHGNQQFPHDSVSFF
ncbi:hypothetical protein SDC9_207137 [bioreactor metagenome]|uniref:Uncharacterized protein n=1 Tax=bioreactor metagenome TaxID=1076179 RepID=A0A645J7K0_9ZZZZ